MSAGRIQAPNDSVSVTLVALLVVYGLVLVASMAVFARRRHLPPLKVRDPYLLAFAVIATYMSCLSLVGFSAQTNAVLNHTLLLPFLAMISLQSARIWTLSLLISKDGGGRPRSRGPVWVAVVAILAALALAQIGVSAASPGGILSLNVHAFHSALLALWSASLAVLTWVVPRRSDDLVGVRRELSLFGFVLLPSVVFVIVWVRLRGIDAVFRNVITGVSLLLLIVQTWYPIWKSYAPDREPAAVVRLTPHSTLFQVLNDNAGLEALHRFMASEFSVENLHCWQVLRDALHDSRPGRVHELFADVYARFVQNGAPEEVNTSAELKLRFQSALNIDRISAVDAGVRWADSETGLDDNAAAVLKRRLLEQLSLGMAG